MSTKAYVMSDGEVVSANKMAAYATKAEESRQLPSDQFRQEYSMVGIVEPLYNLEALAQLLEINSYHYRAVKTKARDTAGLGWYLEPAENLEDRNPSEEQKTLALELLNQPNEEEHIAGVLDKVMVDYDSVGNGYLEVIRDENENINGLAHIPAHTVRIHADGDKFIQQRGAHRVWFKRFGQEIGLNYDTGQQFESQSEVDPEYKATEVLHLKNYTSRSDYYGLPDIIPALGAVLGDRERETYNISFFENHAVPAYAVTVTGTELDQDTKNTIEKYFKHGVKEERHSTLVLEGKKDPSDDSGEPIKIEFQALATEVTDASFQVYRKDNRDEVLSANGVPPYRAGITVEGQLGGSSASESTEIYKQSTVKPRQEMLEQQVTQNLLRRGLGVTDWVFRFNEIDTRDEKAEIERVLSQVKAGILTPNEARGILGYDLSDEPEMDLFYFGSHPIGAPATPQQPTGQVLESVKDLHRDLLAIAQKG